MAEILSPRNNGFYLVDEEREEMCVRERGRVRGAWNIKILKCEPKHSGSHIAAERTNAENFWVIARAPVVSSSYIVERLKVRFLFALLLVLDISAAGCWGISVFDDKTDSSLSGCEREFLNNDLFGIVVWWGKMWQEEGEWEYVRINTKRNN